MKIVNQTKLKVLAKNSRTGSDGKTYYDIAVLSGSEAGNLSCKEEVYNTVAELGEYIFETIYNTDYKSYSITRILQDCSKK